MSLVNAVPPIPVHSEAYGADRFRRCCRMLLCATRVVSDSLNGDKKRTADGEFALAA